MSDVATIAPVREALADFAETMTAALDSLLPQPIGPESRLFEAMRYSALANGKFLRPYLVRTSAAMFDVPETQYLRASAAVEMVHTYSLIHDDLPAMDDDALRRGRATTHIAYDEATAILAGDALQSLAFEVLAGDESAAAQPAICNARTLTLAKACGSRGMVGGQVLDMASEGKAIDQATLERLHQHKTGALLRACVRMAADTDPLLDADRRDALDRFAENIGLAFQVRDDVLH